MTPTKKQTDFDYHSIPPGYYDEVFHRNAGIQSKWHHLKFASVRRSMEQLGRGRVLDVGCGPGTFAGVLDQFEYVGIDLSPAQIEFARKRYGDAHHEFAVSKAGEINFPDNSFDYVTSVEVIEHISPDEAVVMLRSAMRCLKPGGWVVLTTPNYRSHWPILEVLVSKLTPMDYVDQHVTHYTASKLATLLAEIGFAPIQVRSFAHTAPFFAGLNWQLADRIFAFEFGNLNRFGATLIATAQKPA